MTIRVGLIGAGFVADIHAHAYAAVHDVDLSLVGVAATSQSKAQAFADRHGLPAAYDDYRYILERSDIDLVDICTPNAVHEPIVIAAAAAGKHMICEKPLTGYFGGEVQPSLSEPLTDRSCALWPCAVQTA